MPRTIAADAGPFERFAEGDTVAHISIGDGVVKKNTGKVIEVQFEKAYGVYDAIWFKLHPKFLFHRGTAPRAE